MSLSLSVFSQSGPPKSVGGGVGGGGRIPHFNWSIYRGGNFFFFFFFGSGLKLDEKSIENGLEGQKFLVVCLFWGGCHHPNIRDFLRKFGGNSSGRILQDREMIDHTFER